MPKPLLHTAIFHYPHHLSSMLASADGNLHLASAHHGGAFLINSYSRYIKIRYWFTSLKLSYKLAMASVLLLTPTLLLAGLFVLPKSVNYSFYGDNCVSSPVVLPKMVSATSTSGYDVYKVPSLSIAGYPLYSAKTCVELSKNPTANSKTQVKLTSMAILSKKITIETASLPEPAVNTDLKRPISPTESLLFSLDKPDETFDYNLEIDKQTTACKTKSTEVNCSLESLNLVQGSGYEINLIQQFKDYQEVVLSADITLRSPVIIEGSTIQNEEKIYVKPERITLTTNKPLIDVGEYTLTSGEDIIDSKVEISGNSVAIVLSSELPRDSNFQLIIKSATALDGAYLEKPYQLSFSTSGGPKVTSVNFGTYDVSVNKNFVLSFDSNISNTQNLSDYIVLSNSNGIIPASISLYKNSITISPSQALAKCSSFNVRVVDGIASESGITGGSKWSMNSRSTCKTVFSLGSSVQGRALTAYRFGSGATKIVFVSGMHGNERSSYRTLIAFVDELERRYGEIPADKTVVIIPDINPDGYAAQSRTNANGIDLNRNFPSNDWTTGVYMPGGLYLDNGGGASPLDQPESASLASYINSIGPRAVLTYHAVARTVISNGAGDSSALASIYANNSGFAQYDYSHEDGIFNYPTTGEFETWLADKKGIPTLLVELATMSSNEIYSQRSAMWAMLGI